MPLGGLVPLVNMLLGEVIYGGLGTGIYSIVMVALISLFMGGLMVGRTPEYLGKQVGPVEMKLIALYAILGPAAILLLTALAVATEAGQAGLPPMVARTASPKFSMPTRVQWLTTVKILRA